MSIDCKNVRKTKKGLSAGLLMLAFSLYLSGCKEDYNPLLPPGTQNLLVVEGFINSGTGPTSIKLSRTFNLNDSISVNPEKGALVRVEGDDGNTFSLSGDGAGNYTSAQLPLQPSVKYRIYIKTQRGKEYASEYSEVRNTPAIDSVSWQRNNDGVTFFAHTHNDQDASRYYFWKYEETWEFHSAYHNSIQYVYNTAPNSPVLVDYKYPDHHDDTLIYKCWKTIGSSSIQIGSSENLSSNLIYQPIHFIEQGSEKLSVLYSMNLHQYSVSHDAYLFYQKMKKNTEQVGTLFDAQPSLVTGNIKCITDATEQVIGYVEVSQEQSLRMFISKSQLPGWNYDAGCFTVQIDNQSDSIAKYGSGLLPTLPASEDPFGGIISFYASAPVCVDCTLTHTNQRPAFWP